MKKNAVLMILAIFVFASSAIASDTKVYGRMYYQWMMDQSDGSDNFNEFSVNRAYVTLKSKLSEKSYVRITTDLKETDIDGKTRYDVLVKYAYFSAIPDFGGGRLTLKLGLQPTMYFATQNKLWGRRYLSKTVGDLNKFLTTSDLGFSATVALGNDGKYGKVTGAVFNGTAYSDLEEMNKQKDFAGFLMLTPLSDNPDFSRSTIIAQYYAGWQNMAFDTMQSGDYGRTLMSAGAMLGYQNMLDLGIDMHWQTVGMGAGTQDMKASGMSFYGTLYLGELAKDTRFLSTLNLFGRYDMYDPNTETDNDAEKLMIFGLECNPLKGIKASFNYRNETFDNNNPDVKGLYFNTLFKF